MRQHLRFVLPLAVCLAACGGDHPSSPDAPTTIGGDAGAEPTAGETGAALAGAAGPTPGDAGTAPTDAPPDERPDPIDATPDGPAPEPAIVPQLATRNEEVCHLSADGVITCWGKQRPAGTPAYDPNFDPPPGVRFRRLCVGSTASCGLGKDGEIRCWGSSIFEITSPPPGPFVDLACGDIDACALRPNGTATCWGGKDAAAAKAPPAALQLARIVTTAKYGCGLLASGEVQCWGRVQGDAGPLVEARAPAGKFRYIEAGRDQYTCGVTVEDEVVCWGRPKPPTLDAGDWIDLGVSGPVSCALARDGKVTCFGDTTQPRAKPPSGYHLVSIDVGGLHACGLTADAKVVCWGKGLAVTGVPPSLAAPRIESPADASVDGPADASVD